MTSKADFDPYFDIQFRTATKSEFEKWFCDLATCVYGTDFEPIKAGGHHGDKKSDGRCISTETIFQCFAPESAATFAKEAPAKIQDSFPAVLTYWPNLKCWTFVHNNADGIPSTASDVLEALRTAYPTLELRTGNRRFLKELHDKLSLAQLLDIYPKARLVIEGVQMEHVRPLLKRIVQECGKLLNSDYFGDMPDENKIDFNGLSEASKFDIRRAQPHVAVVDRYLVGQSNPSNATIIQNSLRSEYLKLVDLGYAADDLFGKLIDFVKDDSTSQTHAAALVIVTYFFESCDIFENAPA